MNVICDNNTGVCKKCDTYGKCEVVDEVRVTYENTDGSNLIIIISCVTIGLFFLFYIFIRRKKIYKRIFS